NVKTALSDVSVGGLVGLVFIFVRFTTMWSSPLAFAQRARTALRALSLRCLGVSLAARAGPPFLPPFRPSATAAGSFFFVALTAMPQLYVSGQDCCNTSNGVVIEDKKVLE